jgi:hypothetical protein
MAFEAVTNRGSLIIEPSLFGRKVTEQALGDFYSAQFLGRAFWSRIGDNNTYDELLTINAEVGE